jgi:uncharacterized membrane protein
LRVYTVHEPADPPADRIDRAEALRFVREGFTWTAALFAPLWMIARGLWLALIAYVVGVAALAFLASAIGLSHEIRTVVFIALHVLIGFEADQIQRWTLSRNGWQMIGSITGDSALDCERRFLDAWLPGEPMLRPEALSASHFTGSGTAALGVRGAPRRSGFSSLFRR